MAERPGDFVPRGPGLELLACVEYAHEDWATPKIKTTELEMVVKVFRYNMARVRMMMIMPAQVGDLGLRIQRCLDLAEFEATGKLPRIAAPTVGQIAQNFDQIWTATVAEDSLIKKDSARWDQHVFDSLVKGLDPVVVLGNSGPTGGFQAMFASFIISTWTAIETMAGDLWETALNVHPQKLSRLAGSAKRLRKTNKSSVIWPTPRISESESKAVPLDLVQMHQFDLREKMGSVLRGRFGFSTLDGIREAYSSAFDRNYTDIDAALSNDALDALSAVRNVIVHRAAIADAEYARRAKYLPLPFRKEGIPIILEGKITVGLIKPAVVCAANLIGAVDDWIAKDVPEEAATPP